MKTFKHPGQNKAPDKTPFLKAFLMLFIITPNHVGIDIN
ncbi:hypothetical protein LPE509_p00052 (plasmid) [Legionella pneumophila subsp. pneumophila LPE509]|nr:hypothetical protein LPE509_p00052 [Legionella pneumophila subsp. pneumophila LPE509]